MADRTIWKFPIRIDDQQAVTLPADSRILTVQVQSEAPCIWALVNPSTDKLERYDLRMVGTGHPFNDADDWPVYIGTFQLPYVGLVFHLFTRGES